ncbi:PilW family protein, partial [Patescibacteria group bacterium]
MKVKKVTRKGLTLIETLLFVALTGIFLTFGTAVMNGFLKSRNRARKMSSLQETSTYILDQLTQEIHWSQEAEIFPKELKLTRTLPDDTIQETTFILENDRLLKNNAPLSPETIRVNNFEVTDVTAGEETPCLKIELGLEVIVSDPILMSENQTTISLRKNEFQPTPVPNESPTLIPTLDPFDTPPPLPTPTSLEPLECRCGETDPCRAGLVCNHWNCMSPLPR